MARILFADDGVEQLAVHRTLLESLGYEVVTAMSVEAALEEIPRSRPDLIVVDLGMPQPSDGLRLIRGIRESGCDAPVVVLSGWPEDIYGAPEENMVSRILTKGLIRELLQVIQELLGS
jgi:CheY-like chemotaxis protein